MNSFRQHIPAFARDGREPPEPDYPFNTTAELLALPIVQRYIGPTFSHFALSDNRLMEISDDGYHWWVVGSIRHPNDVDLPKWEGWKHLARLEDGREVTLTTEVVSSCGGRLELRDGTVATNVLYERQMAKQKSDSEKRDRGICPTCDTPYHRTESPDENANGPLIRLEQRCLTCGGHMTSWRPL